MFVDPTPADPNCFALPSDGKRSRTWDDLKKRWGGKEVIQRKCEIRMRGDAVYGKSLAVFAPDSPTCEVELPHLRKSIPQVMREMLDALEIVL